MSSAFIRRSWILLVLVTLFISVGFAVILFAPSRTQIASARASNSLLQQIEQQIRQIASRTGGTLGVSTTELTTGQKISVNGDEPFLMASTYKVPIALPLLHQVGQGKIDLDEQIPIQPKDLRLISVISTYFDPPQLAVSVKNLLDLMLVASDNTASDILLQKAGGAAAVTHYLNAHDLTDIRANRTEAQLLANEFSVTLLPESQWSL